MIELEANVTHIGVDEFGHKAAVGKHIIILENNVVFTESYDKLPHPDDQIPVRLQLGISVHERQLPVCAVVHLHAVFNERIQFFGGFHTGIANIKPVGIVIETVFPSRFD
jgi:hypothetical protein